MKIRAIILSVMIASGISAVILYGRAAQPEEMPSIIMQAVSEKDTPMLIKNLILRMKAELEVNNDQFPTLIQEVDSYASSRTDSASVAILRSMLAEMYQQYYQRNRGKINQRTELSGYIPEDIREWTANLFTDKIREELTASLRPADLLQATPAHRFREILMVGEDAQSLRPTLYEFLAFRALDMQPSVELYKEVIAFQNKQSNQQAALLTELDYLRFLYGDKRDQASFEAYRTALDELYREQAAFPYAAEIVIAQVEWISRNLYRHDSSQWDSIRAEEIRLCEEGIKRYPAYPRTAVLKNHLAVLERPSLSISTPNTVYPGKELAIETHYKNIREVSLRIYSRLQESKQLVKEETYFLRLPNTYTQQDTTLCLSLDQPGLYECVVSAKEADLKMSTTVSVSRLAAIHRNLPDNHQWEIFATDYLSGKPVERAIVTYYGGNRRDPVKRGSVQTDKQGLALLPADNRIVAYQVSLPGDTAGRKTNLYSNGSLRNSATETVEVSLFTDRGLYRPGQTLFFKGIAYVKDTDQPHTVAEQPYTVTLYGANGKEIAHHQFTTNEFGSFHGEFTLPKQTLSGTFRLHAGRKNAYIQVEEYKRPTFQASFLPIKEEIAFGDSVMLHGKAETFAGISLPEGEVSWRILRRFFLRGGFRSASAAQVAEGSTALSADGSFQVAFRPQREETSDPSTSLHYIYEVFASVTDSKGETQETKTYFSVGTSSIVLLANLSEQVEKESVEVIVEARTLNGEETSVSGIFRIMELIEAKSGEIKEGQALASGSFTSGQAIDPSVFSQLQSGRYRFYVEANDQQGRPCQSQQEFILYGKNDPCPPVFSHTWILRERTSCLPDEETEILFGTSDQDAYILYEWFNGGKRIHREQIRLSNANRLFRIPFQTEYGDGMVVSFTFMKEGELHTAQIPIERRLPDRELTIKPITFRDHLLPGGQESWRFRITDADSAIVSAEVLAGMYDASLDRLTPFYWMFAPRRSIRLQAPRFSVSVGLQKGHQAERVSTDRLQEIEYQYDQLNWFDLFDAGRARGGILFSSKNSLMRSANAPLAAEMNVSEEDQAMALAKTDESTEGEAFVDEISPEEETPVQLAQVRQDFSETAFFYPTLRTDEQGDVFLQFTLPESNTAWKFQLLANTEDLKYGLLTREVISNKPLMLLPNLPRFVRQGDQVSVSAQVINHSREPITGRVRIELFDPATEEPILCLSKSQRPFELQPDSVKTVRWLVPIPSQGNLMGVRILADSEQGSDGEQHLLPVLPDQLMITESTPFFLKDEGNEQITLSGTSKTPFRLTLEITANPIWYAVQALPTITRPTHDNILSWFAAYYSNTLATHIARSNPRIRKVIDQWMAEGGDVSTLYSNLERNQELKNILLEETPWVLAAENETEQKQRLSMLFDLKRANDLREEALRQLIQRQAEDGGWAWCKGFPVSRTITLAILKGMSQLTRLNAIQYGEKEREMQIKALGFLDKRIRLDYESLKKLHPQWQDAQPDGTQVDYLFVRTAYRDVPEPEEAREAIRFYTRQAEAFWKKLSLMRKGEVALLAYRNGQKGVASEIFSWLRKTATISEEKGMYWANNRRENTPFASPIDTHCLLMAAFEEISPDVQQTDLMKQWLLCQKRTQDWESVPATLNAIYTLLLTGADWLETNNACFVTWGGQTYSTDTTTAETATGYLKAELSAEETAVLSIRKDGNTPAWGAVYKQYFQDINEVEAHKGVLNVEKKLFVEVNTGSDIQIRPVTSDQPLRVGDKVIVRLTIRSDREMDYVYLKDLRAGCFEPAISRSGTEWRDGVRYYRSPKDVSENFYFDRLPEGTFVLEYPVYATRSGEYAGGISTIQCLYAPEFVSHTAGKLLRVE